MVDDPVEVVHAVRFPTVLAQERCQVQILDWEPDPSLDLLGLVLLFLKAFEVEHQDLGQFHKLHLVLVIAPFFAVLVFTSVF